MVVVVIVVQTVGRWQLVQVVVVVMAHAELGHDVMQLVLAQDAEDLEVAFGMFGEAACQQAAGRAAGRDVLLETSHGSPRSVSGVLSGEERCARSCGPGRGRNRSAGSARIW